MTVHYQSLDPLDDSAAGARQELQARPAVADSRTFEAEQPVPVGSARPVKAKKALFSIGKTIKSDVVMAFSRQLSSFHGRYLGPRRARDRCPANSITADAHRHQ